MVGIDKDKYCYRRNSSGEIGLREKFDSEETAANFGLDIMIVAWAVGEHELNWGIFFLSLIKKLPFDWRVEKKDKQPDFSFFPRWQVSLLHGKVHFFQYQVKIDISPVLGTLLWLD